VVELRITQNRAESVSCSWFVVHDLELGVFVKEVSPRVVADRKTTRENGLYWVRFGWKSRPREKDHGPLYIGSLSSAGSVWREVVAVVRFAEIVNDNGA